MSVLEYDKEVPFYNELKTVATTLTTSKNEQNVTVAEEQYTYAESDDWKLLNKYDLMLNKNVDYAKKLINCLQVMAMTMQS